MALTATQKVTVAEITQESLALVESASSSLTPEQETAIIADIATWNTNRNKVKTWIEKGPSGVNVRTRNLLAEIRMRTRNAFGWPLFSEQTHPTSGSVAVRGVF
jgi:hypothetical protein